MSSIRNLLIVSLLLVLAGVASAQVLEIGPQFGVNRLSNSELYSQADPPAVARLKSGFRFGFRVADLIPDLIFEFIHRTHDSRFE